MEIGNGIAIAGIWLFVGIVTASRYSGALLVLGAIGLGTYLTLLLK